MECIAGRSLQSLAGATHRTQYKVSLCAEQRSCRVTRSTLAALRTSHTLEPRKGRAEASQTSVVPGGSCRRAGASGEIRSQATSPFQ